MLDVQDKISKAYEELEVKEGNEKIMICIVAETNNITLETTTCLLMQGSKVNQTKIVKQLLLTEGANELTEILNAIYQNEEE